MLLNCCLGTTPQGFAGLRGKYGKVLSRYHRLIYMAAPDSLTIIPGPGASTAPDRSSRIIPTRRPRTNGGSRMTQARRDTGESPLKIAHPCPRKPRLYPRTSMDMPAFAVPVVRRGIFRVLLTIHSASPVLMLFFIPAELLDTDDKKRRNKPSTNLHARSVM